MGMELMITIAIIAIILAFFLGTLWPNPIPSIVCIGIALISLVFKYAP
jgi:hypothetical protein